MTTRAHRTSRPDLAAPCPVDQHLLRVVSRRVGPERASWLAGALGRVRDAASAAQVFEQSTRVLGDELVWLDPEERWAMERDGGPGSLVGWTLDCCARVAVLLRARDEMSAADHAALLFRVYEGGDGAGQKAVLRALPMLPEAPRLTPCPDD